VSEILGKLEAIVGGVLWAGVEQEQMVVVTRRIH
jgi:hypothetical protein